MSENHPSLNFIEQIIEEDLKNGNIKSKAFYRFMMHRVKKSNKKETQEHRRKMNIIMTREMPLRSVASFSDTPNPSV